MTRTAVISSNLRSIGYHAASKTLEVEFKSGSVYAYSDVPEYVYNRLMSAESKGATFAAEIKHVYPWEKVG
jgi:hypothetical protein